MGFDVDRRALRWWPQSQFSNGCERGPYIVAGSQSGGNPTHYVAEVCGAPYLGSVDTWPIARMLAEANELLAVCEDLYGQLDPAVFGDELVRRLEAAVDRAREAAPPR